MGYLNKYKGQEGRRSIYDIYNLTDTQTDENGDLIIKKYEAVDIYKVEIDNRVFTNYGQYSFIWEKTYVESPQRSSKGNLGNLNSQATFLTPHLIIDFSVMSIDDYRTIMKLHYERNEFVVKCYDPIYNRTIKVKMYFATEEMAKLYTIQKKRLNGTEWEDWVELVGVREYSVELIGTNNELDLVTVFYKYNAPIVDGVPIYPTGSPVPDQAEEDVYMGEEIVIGANSTFPDMPPSSGWKFKEWVNENGETYSNGIVLTVNEPIVLYAVWEKTTSYTLSFNYGLSKPMTRINDKGELEEVYDKEITDISNIGTLPTFDPSPYVEDSNTKENGEPYRNGAWYKHPVRQDNMKVESNQKYWATRNTIIYLLYEKVPFTVQYITNAPDISVPIQTLGYGDTVYLPNLYREGYTLDGWYIDSNFTTKFSGPMPPKDLILHAKWVAK